MFFKNMIINLFKVIVIYIYFLFILLLLQKKVDKRDLPENNNFFCDTCDRGFKTQEKYEEHVNGHQEVQNILILISTAFYTWPKSYKICGGRANLPYTHL